MRKLIYSVLLTFSLIVFLVHYSVSGQAVYGDGIGYFAHLHSWVIDRDWDYTNEYKHLYNHEYNNLNIDALAPVVQIVSVTSTGKAENFYGTGVAVLLLPYYLLAHLMSNILNFIGAVLPTHGYSDLYQIYVGIGAIFYTIAGLIFLEKSIVKITHNKLIGLLAALTIFSSTSLLYYGSFDVLNSHFASFFLSSVFFYLFLSKKRNNFLLGLVAGLMTITRIQDFAIVFIWGLDTLLIYLSNKTKLGIGLLFKNAGTFLSGMVISLMPLIVHWGTVYGNPLKHTYLRGILEKYQDNPTLDIFGSLFNPITGLFFRTPILLIIFIYFLYLLKKKKTTDLINPFIFFLIQFFIITIQGGWSAAAFGGRMYISSLVFFGLVLGKLLLHLSKKKQVFVYLFISVFTVINFISMAMFILREKGTEGGLHGIETKTVQRIKSITLPSWCKIIFE